MSELRKAHIMMRRLSISASMVIMMSFAMISNVAADQHKVITENRQTKTSEEDLIQGPLSFKAARGDAVLLTSTGRQLYVGKDGDNLTLPFLHQGQYELQITNSTRLTNAEITKYKIEIPAMGAPIISRENSTRSTMPTAIFGIAALISAALLSKRHRNKLTYAAAILLIITGPIRIIDSSPNIKGLILAVISVLLGTWLWRIERYRLLTPLLALIFPPLTAPALVFAPIVAALTIPRTLVMRRAVIALAGLSTATLLFVIASTLQPPSPELTRPVAKVAQLTNCSLIDDTNNRGQCAVDYFMGRLEGGVDLNKVLSELISAQYDTLFNSKGLNCHGVSHNLGKKLYEIGIMPSQLGDISSNCGAGLLHGLVEQAGVSANDLEFKKIAASCDLPNPGLAKTCSHGIGHGVYARAGGDLVSAISLCAKVGVLINEECIAGALMIYSEAWTSFARFGTWPNHIKPNPIVSEPLDACTLNKLKKYESICIESIIQLYRNYDLENVNPEISDIELAAKWCNEQPQQRVACADGLGSAVYGYLDTPDPAKVSSICNTTDMERCVRALTKVHTFMSSISGKTATSDFCDNIKIGLSFCREEIAKMNELNLAIQPNN
jgi:hypothetical protein